MRFSARCKNRCTVTAGEGKREFAGRSFRRGVLNRRPSPGSCNFSGDQRFGGGLNKDTSRWPSCWRSVVPPSKVQGLLGPSLILLKSYFRKTRAGDHSTNSQLTDRYICHVLPIDKRCVAFSGDAERPSRSKII